MSKSDLGRLADLRLGSLVEPESQPSLFERLLLGLILAGALWGCLGAVDLALLVPIDPGAFLGVKHAR